MTTTSDVSGDTVLLLGGGIGAGKSRVASLFADAGCTIIEADAVGRSVLERGTGAVDDVAELWPEVVADGVVDRAALARIVFADAEELARLEAITHPEIGRLINEGIEAANGPVVVEIPVMAILSESPYVRVAVIADASVREDRAVARGGDRADVRRRMSHQPSDAQWVAWADSVIDNSGAWSHTSSAVAALITEVLGNG
jgi:dephospho-CoA kinase